MGAPANHFTGFGSDFYRWILQVLSAPSSGYKRLRSQNSRRRRVRILKLGKRRTLKIKRLPKLQFRWISPFAVLAKLRDAYVNLLLAASSKLSSTDALVMGSSFGGGLPMGSSFGQITSKEYEQKVLVELYKSMAQTQMMLASSS